MRRLCFFLHSEFRLRFRSVIGLLSLFVFPSLVIMFLGGLQGNGPQTVLNSLGAIDVVLPGVITLISGLTGLTGLPVTLFRYRSGKYSATLELSGLPRPLLYLALLFVDLIMTLLGISVVLGVAGIVYRIVIPGNVLLILPLLLLDIVSVQMLGLFLFALLDRSRPGIIIVRVLFFLMIILGGSLFPVELMDEAWQQAAVVWPFYHATAALKGAWLAQAFASWSTSFYITLALTLIFLGLAIPLLSRKRSCP